MIVDMKCQHPSGCLANLDTIRVFHGMPYGKILCQMHAGEDLKWRKDHVEKWNSKLLAILDIIGGLEGVTHLPTPYTTPSAILKFGEDTCQVNENGGVYFGTSYFNIKHFDKVEIFHQLFFVTDWSKGKTS